MYINKHLHINFNDFEFMNFNDFIKQTIIKSLQQCPHLIMNNILRQNLFSSPTSKLITMFSRTSLIKQIEFNKTLSKLQAKQSFI